MSDQFLYRRREFITLLGGAAVAWPLVVRAQQAMRVVGWLNSETPDGYGPMVAAFRRGLSEMGFVEGHSVAIEYRWAEGHNDRLPALAADLINRQVAVLAAAGTPATFAAKAATTTIPIVFSTAADPVAEGLVPSLSRPGGNATGVTNLGTELMQKQIEKLHEMVPTAAVMAALINPTDPPLAEPATKDVQAAGRTLGLQIHILHASTQGEIDAAFATLVKMGARGLVIAPHAFFISRRRQIAALALRHAIPAIYYFSRLRRRWRSDELWPQRHRWLSPRRRLRWANSQGRPAGRLAGAAVYQVRARHKSYHCQGSRPRSTVPSATACRRDDRMKRRAQRGRRVK
jgi:ABC-type uncharacterized transport system substrate-binding protein